jgi:hypothetical protein
MNGNMMYELAKQRMAEQQRAAREAGEARSRRAAARGRHAKAAPVAEIGTPVIPDFADEMFAAARDAGPQHRAGGRHARSGR